jgi:amino acid permease
MSPTAAKLHVPLLSEHKPALRHASVCGAVFNVSTSIIGTGIMSIPTTLKVLGVILAFLLFLVIALLSDVLVEFLMRFTHSVTQQPTPVS